MDSVIHLLRLHSLGFVKVLESQVQSLAHEPMLGHITTFGGHPVCCAAGLAALNYLIDNKVVETVANKEELFRKKLILRRSIDLS